MGSAAATRFGHYRVLTHADGSLWTLGSGAMGVTYRAVDERLEVEVALKVIASGKARQPGVEERFLKEARAAARVRHPHVASVLFLHDTPGELFFAMEFIAGVSLAEWLRERRPVPPGLVIEFGQQLAQGLAAIHAQGIVHRDLKPTNIMVVRDGERAENEAGAWRLKIIDFGVARTPLLLDRAATASGIFCGTAAYASPEQAGQGEAVDGRADLYALGCILWEMLAGHPPFRAEGLRELLQAHAVVPPPYDEIAHQPPSLTAILLRLLAKDPRERPADAAEVLRALERAKERLAEEGGSRESTGLTQAFFRLAPGPDSTTTAASRPPRSRAWQIALGLGVVCLAAVAGFLGWRNSARPAADAAAQRIVAVLPFEQIDSSPEEAAFAVGLQEDVLSQLSQVTELRVISRTSVLAFRTSPRTVRDIAANLGAGSVVEGSVRRFRQRVWIKAQLVDARADRVLWSEAFERPWPDSFALQSELSASIARAVQVRLAPGRAGLLPDRRTADAGAYEIYRRGLEAFRRLRVADNEEAIELFQKSIAKDAQFALAHAALADAYVMKVDRFEAPIYWLDAAIQAAEKSVALDPRCAEGHGALGAACAARGWFGRARRAFQKAVELKPSFAEPTIRLANLLFFTGQWEEAWSLARRGVELEPQAPSASLCLAILHLGVGAEEAGERWLRRAMARLDDPLKRQHLEILLAYSRRDYAAVNRLMDERARSGVNAAQLYFSEIPGVVPPGYLHFMANWRLGKLAVCRSHLDAALRVADPDGFNYRQILVSEVVLLRAEGRLDEMAATARKLIALTERNEGAGSDAPEPRINKAVAYWLIGDRPRAEASIAAALRSELFLGRVDQDDTNVDALVDCPAFTLALAEMNARLSGLRARLTQLDLEQPFRGP